MKVRSGLRSGKDVGEYLGDARSLGAGALQQLSPALEGAKSFGSGAVRQAGSLLGKVGSSLGDRKLWTWPF